VNIEAYKPFGLLIHKRRIEKNGGFRLLWEKMRTTFTINYSLVDVYEVLMHTFLPFLIKKLTLLTKVPFML
jgi:hypothetical protein